MTKEKKEAYENTEALPRLFTACTLICGVVVGITMTARQPIFAADSATPCAWLPAEAQITPRFCFSGESLTILL